MRHHIHCLDLHGIVGSYPDEGGIDTSDPVINEEGKNGTVKHTVDTNYIVKKNGSVYVPFYHLADFWPMHQREPPTTMGFDTPYRTTMTV